MKPSLAARSREDCEAESDKVWFLAVISERKEDVLHSTAIYLHIPFCRTKCSYCDFNTYAGIEPLIPRYLEALKEEVERAPRGLPVHTLNFGGGTPSLLSPRQLVDVIETCRRRFSLASDAEISIEANPGGLDEDYFRGIRDAGVNRLSLGVQSLRASELAMLSRRHDAAEAKRALALARSAGFQNINLDLMYGLPGQTLAQWQESLDAVLALRPEHLSMYGLSVYEHLPLGRQVAEGIFPSQDDDLVAEMYELAEDLAAQAGYEQYEIWNWAVGAAFRCRHNLAYWCGTGYIGLGAGAHSYFGGFRYANEKNPGRYIEKALAGDDLVCEREKIGPELKEAEDALLALRLNEGTQLSPDQFERLDPCREAGLLTVEGMHARLTNKGRLLSNEVFWRLLPE